MPAVSSPRHVPRIVFMGTPALAADFLAQGMACYPTVFQHIVLCVTQPDRPAGRGKRLTASPVKQWAQAQGIPIWQPETFRTAMAQNTLREWAPDLIWVAAYGLLLPPAVLDLAPCWNVHYSLLPRYRGASPIQQAILQGDPETGITIMQMDPGLDTGPILAQAVCPLDPAADAEQLIPQLTTLAVPVMVQVWDQYQQGTLQPKPQSAIKIPPSLAPKFTKADAQIQCAQETALQVVRKVRAFRGGIGAWLLHRGQSLKIHTAFQSHLHPDRDLAPGTIWRCDRQGVWVQTTAGIAVLETLQFPGRKPQTPAQWSSGRHPFEIGASLG